MGTGEHELLVVIDVQNDFCPGGALAVPGGDEVVPMINSLSAHFAHFVLTQDWHPAGHGSFASSHAGRAPFELTDMPYGPQVLWPDHCVQDSPGAAFHEALNIAGAELILRKGFRPPVDSYSAFYENDRETSTGFTGYLRSRSFTRLHFAGLATDFCVAYSALDARREGFEAVVIEDACRAIDLDGSLASAMSELRDAGVEFSQSSAYR